MRALFPGYTQITDAGLVHLGGMTGLKHLSLARTQITDAGLVHLEGLTGLQELYLPRIPITDAGLAALRKALPKTTIRR